MPGYVWFALGLFVGVVMMLLIQGHGWIALAAVVLTAVICVGASLLVASGQSDDDSDLIEARHDARLWQAKCEQMQWAIDHDGREVPRREEVTSGLD